MKIGDRVVPVKKSIGFGLDSCKEWNDIGKEQGYLYIVAEHSEGYILSAFDHRDNGSLYGYDDIVPFNKDSKEFEDIKNGIWINDLCIETEYGYEKDFKKALTNKEEIVCMSNFQKNYIETLNIKQVEQLYNYLGEVLNYCNDV